VAGSHFLVNNFYFYHQLVAARDSLPLIGGRLNFLFLPPISGSLPLIGGSLIFFGQ